MSDKRKTVEELRAKIKEALLPYVGRELNEEVRNEIVKTTEAIMEEFYGNVKDVES